MRKKQTIYMCPRCKSLADLAVGTRGGRLCVNCNWAGKASDMGTHEFYVEDVSYTKIDYDVIDRIVYLFYGRSPERSNMPHFEMVCNGEWCNDSSHQFDVDGKIGQYEREDAAKFRKDGKPRGLSNADVMNILCADGWLEPGAYLVEVCW